MIAEQATNWGYLGAAAIATIPATLAWWSARKTGKKVETNHGKTIGQHVEKLGDDLANLATLFAEHAVQDAQNFIELRHLVVSHQAKDQA